MCPHRGRGVLSVTVLPGVLFLAMGAQVAVTASQKVRRIRLPIKPLITRSSVAGIPSKEFSEMLLFEQVAPLITGFNSKVLPPTIIAW
jgi:hypothetical protein